MSDLIDAAGFVKVEGASRRGEPETSWILLNAS